MSKVIHIFGIPFQDLDFPEAVDKIGEMIRGSTAQQVVLANAHTLNLSYVQPVYRRQLKNASMVLRDGTGVKIAAIIAGKQLRYNFVGTDFVPKLLANLDSTDISAYLFGAKPSVVQAAAAELNRRCPNLKIAGYQHGDLPRKDWNGAVVDKINALRPDVLLVALGNPLQEMWIADNLSKLNVKVAIGVGALFDYLSGEIPRAPEWIRKSGFEWAYRLGVEPRRLWRRYLIGNFQFLYRILASRTWARDLRSETRQLRTEATDQTDFDKQRRK